MLRFQPAIGYVEEFSQSCVDANNFSIPFHSRTCDWVCRHLVLQLAELVGANPASRRWRLHDVCGVRNDPGLRVSLGT